MTGSPLANPSATRATLEAYGLATKHRLGQNFLISNAVIKKIMDLAALSHDEHVIEVGPGIGTLTLALLADAGRVTSIEMDQTLEPVLSSIAAAHPSFTYIMGDALRIDVTALADAPEAFVSNLPYNVAATLILAYMQTIPSLKRCVVMVQSEVADRICARPGTKTYGAYTAKLALYGKVTGRFAVGAHNFMPPPHVESAVVRIERAPLVPSLTPEELQACARVIDAAFAQRRKTIRNSMMSSGFAAEALDEAFSKLAFDPRRRAETCSPEEFVELTQVLKDCGGVS